MGCSGCRPARKRLGYHSCDPRPPGGLLETSTGRAPCPYCGRAAGRLFRTTDLNRRATAEHFDYHRCHACGLIFVHPVPADLGRFYPPEYHGEPTPEQLAVAAELERYKLDLVLRYVRSGRLLEVGSGYGAFALLAVRAGFRVEAVEPDEGCRRFLTDTVGVRAHRSLDELPAVKDGGQFNVIALWHSFEHLPEPWVALRSIIDRLVPGGIVVIATPNPEALQFGLFGRRWVHVDAPRHVELVPAALLARESRRLGLGVTETTYIDPGSLGWNAFGWEQTLGNMASRPRVRLVLERVGSLIARVVSPLERTGRRGSTYTVVLRRPE